MQLYPLSMGGYDEYLGEELPNTSPRLKSKQNRHDYYPEETNIRFIFYDNTTESCKVSSIS
jgi:hypothetical protein